MILTYFTHPIGGTPNLALKKGHKKKRKHNRNDNMQAWAFKTRDGLKRNVPDSHTHTDRQLFHPYRLLRRNLPIRTSKSVRKEKPLI